MKTNLLNTRAKATVYAEVLLGAARVRNNVFDVAGQLDQLVAAVRGSIELRKALIDKTIPAAAKKGIVAEIFSSFAPELLTTFDVMVDRGDLSLLPRVRDTYVALAEKALGAAFVDVTTVVPLDETLREQIVTKYSAQLGRKVMLREYVDPGLIGGIVLSAHGKRIDASVSSQLESARHVLSKTV
ncbi:MAG: ATP synthase F1 subunit delta [Coriobacteriia bacterium]|nr:ATP synthase F1 subunit delta [Coriobacteriia bacterium]MCL2750057.1 ATP synthase F1 subunit delta [Coriobacteriia bacterium]